MKKLLTAIILCLLLAVPVMAHAVDIPAQSITITAQTVDYVSAMAGVAKPVNKAYAENERFALLVRVDIPSYLSTDAMELIVYPNGCTIDSTAGMALATGDYLLYGTVLSTGAKVQITAKDNAIKTASTAGELWAALYGDRTATATASFGIAPAQLVTQDATTIPKTGDNTGYGGIVFVLVAAALVWMVKKYA